MAAPLWDSMPQCPLSAGLTTSPSRRLPLGTASPCWLPLPLHLLRDNQVFRRPPLRSAVHSGWPPRQALSIRLLPRYPHSSNTLDWAFFTGLCFQYPQLLWAWHSAFMDREFREDSCLFIRIQSPEIPFLTFSKTSPPKWLLQTTLPLIALFTLHL